MKLLFDENLSPKLVAALADIFPNSAHVHEIGLWVARWIVRYGSTLAIMTTHL
jgi:predicted nuclease of predicted toxin-antitoxin system